MNPKMIRIRSIQSIEYLFEVGKLQDVHQELWLWYPDSKPHRLLMQWLIWLPVRIPQVDHPLDWLPRKISHWTFTGVTSLGWGSGSIINQYNNIYNKYNQYQILDQSSHEYSLRIPDIQVLLGFPVAESTQVMLEAAASSERCDVFFFWRRSNDGSLVWTKAPIWLGSFEGKCVIIFNIYVI